MAWGIWANTSSIVQPTQTVPRQSHGGVASCRSSSGVIYCQPVNLSCAQEWLKTLTPPPSPDKEGFRFQIPEELVSGLLLTREWN